MVRSKVLRVVGLGAWVLLLTLASVAVIDPASGSRSGLTVSSGSAPTLPSSTFVSAPPTGAAGPDDLTALAIPGFDHGRLVIWTAYQNGINPDGTPGTPGGPTASTVVGYDRATGAIVRSINVTGKVDGLTADPAMGTLIATVNEDDHSALDLIVPAIGAVAHYTYHPDPAVAGVGGTDIIAIVDGRIYVAHSNPSDTSQATDYRVTLHPTTLTANLSPVFFDDSSAVDALSGATVPLALTDPDTNYAMPASSPGFANTLATISQADGKVVFASHLRGSVRLSVLTLSDNVTGNVPPADGLAVATCDAGTLYVVDAKAGTITALSTRGWPAGTVFIGEPNDNANALVGTLNLRSGSITPLGNHFASPKGLLFVPDRCGHSDRDHAHPHVGDDGSIGGGVRGRSFAEPVGER